MSRRRLQELGAKLDRLEGRASDHLPRVEIVLPDNASGPRAPFRRGMVELHITDPTTDLCRCGEVHALVAVESGTTSAGATGAGGDDNPGSGQADF